MKFSRLTQTSVFAFISYIIAFIISIPILFFYFDFVIFPNTGFAAMLLPLAVIEYGPFVAIILSIPIFVVLRSGVLRKLLKKN